MDTYSEGPYKSFDEETLKALLGKENHFVALGTDPGTVKLATNGDEVIGVLHERLSLETKQVTVRLIGKGGTVKVRAGGVIAKGGRVVWGTGAKAIAQPGTAGTYRTLGRKLANGNSADNDIIEILDTVEPVTVAG